MIENNRGNWLESRLSQLGGKFAGLVLVALPTADGSACQRRFEGHALKFCLLAPTMADSVNRESFVDQYRGTTILSVRRQGRVVVGGDGQVSLGNTVMKGNARKVRRLHHDRILSSPVGPAGS